MAVTDRLSGVVNRLGFDLELQKIEQEMKKNPDLGVYLFLIDLDRFKEVNDEYGHDAVDKVLRYFTKLLRKTLRKTDFVGRLGGDEFVVLIRNLDMPEKAEIIAQAVIENLALPITIAPDEKVETGASIGISYYKGLCWTKRS
jgi:diguanylate cyclase (GGDEF)-like protein